METEVTNEKQKYKSLVSSRQKELKATERAEKAEKEMSTLKAALKSLKQQLNTYAAAERKANSKKPTKGSLEATVFTQVDETQRGIKKKRKTVEEDDSELPSINSVTNASSLSMDTTNQHIIKQQLQQQELQQQLLLLLQQQQ